MMSGNESTGIEELLVDVAFGDCELNAALVVAFTSETCQPSSVEHGSLWPRPKEGAANESEKRQVKECRHFEDLHQAPSA